MFLMVKGKAEGVNVNKSNIGDSQEVKRPPPNQCKHDPGERAKSAGSLREIAKAAGGGDEECEAGFASGSRGRCGWRQSVRRPRFGARGHPCSSASDGGAPRSRSSNMDSSNAGSLITYFSLAQLPRSSKRHRSLQNGKSAYVSESVGFLQIGQRATMRRAYRKHPLRGAQLMWSLVVPRGLLPQPHPYPGGSAGQNQDARNHGEGEDHLLEAIHLPDECPLISG